MKVRLKPHELENRVDQEDNPNPKNPI